MRDLASPRLMYAKALLFLGIGLLAAALLFIDRPALRTAALMAVMVWAFARAYYFAFYVLERYVDPGFRFAGIVSLVRYLMRRS